MPLDIMDTNTRGTNKQVTVIEMCFNNDISPERKAEYLRSIHDSTTFSFAIYIIHPQTHIKIYIGARI